MWIILSSNAAVMLKIWQLYSKSVLLASLKDNYKFNNKNINQKADIERWKVLEWRERDQLSIWGKYKNNNVFILHKSQTYNKIQVHIQIQNNNFIKEGDRDLDHYQGKEEDLFKNRAPGKEKLKEKEVKKN